MDHLQLFAHTLTVLIVVFQSSRIWKLQQYLDASEAETKWWKERAKKFVDRAHKAEEELEALKPEIDDWFFSRQLEGGK